MYYDLCIDEFVLSGGCDEADFAQLDDGGVALLDYTTDTEDCSLYDRVSRVQ